MNKQYVVFITDQGFPIDIGVTAQLSDSDAPPESLVSAWLTQDTVGVAIPSIESDQRPVVKVLVPNGALNPFCTVAFITHAGRNFLSAAVDTERLAQEWQAEGRQEKWSPHGPEDERA